MNFRDKLKSKTEEAKKSGSDIAIINMQNRDNYGSIVFVPIVPASGKDSVAILMKVLQIAEEYTYKDKQDNNKEKKGKRWINILNLEDYGEDLDQAQIDQYSRIQSMAKKLSKHEFSKSKKDNKAKRDSILKTKNYTILIGWVIEHRNKADKLIHKDMPALLVFSSSRFDDAFEDAMKSKDKKMGTNDWMVRLFNDGLHRKMYMDISYKLSDSKKVIGYIANVSIEKFDEDTQRYTNGNPEELDLTQYQEKIAKIMDPVCHFLRMQSEGEYFSQNQMNRAEYQLQCYLNKYCGTNYDIKKPVEKVATVDPLDYVKKDDDSELPPEDKPTGDVWDEE